MPSDFFEDKVVVRTERYIYHNNMPVFVYQATDRTGKLVEGTIEAKDESLVINRLHGLQLLPIKVEKEGASQKSQIFNFQFSIFNLFTGVSRKELMSFTQQLATLSNS